MNIENFLYEAVKSSVEALYGTLEGEQLQIQKTRKEFEGDYTLVTFPPAQAQPQISRGYSQRDW